MMNLTYIYLLNCMIIVINIELKPLKGFTSNTLMSINFISLNLIILLIFFQNTHNIFELLLLPFPYPKNHAKSSSC